MERKNIIGVELNSEQKQLLKEIVAEVPEYQQGYFCGKVAYALTLKGWEQETYMKTLASRYWTNLTSAKVIEENKAPSQNIDDDELREVQNTVQNILEMIKSK